MDLSFRWFLSSLSTFVFFIPPDAPPSALLIVFIPSDHALSLTSFFPQCQTTFKVVTLVPNLSSWVPLSAYEEFILKLCSRVLESLTSFFPQRQTTRVAVRIAPKYRSFVMKYLLHRLGRSALQVKVQVQQDQVSQLGEVWIRWNPLLGQCRALILVSTKIFSFFVNSPLVFTSTVTIKFGFRS